MKTLKFLDDLLDKFARWGLVFSVLTMLILTVITIVMRWFDSSIHWVEPFVRHLVFLSTFLGGVLATGRGEHIGIDIIGKWLESRNMEKGLVIVNRLISLTACLTLVWMIKSSYDFFLIELKYGKAVFWGIKSGYLVSIIPFGFSLIAYRFFYKFVSSFLGDEQ